MAVLLFLQISSCRVLIGIGYCHIAYRSSDMILILLTGKNSIIISTSFLIEKTFRAYHVLRFFISKIFVFHFQ